MQTLLLLRELVSQISKSCWDDEEEEMLFSLSLTVLMAIEETQPPVIHSDAIEFLTESGSVKKFDMDLVSLSSSTVPQFSAATPLFTLQLLFWARTLSSLLK